MSMYGRHDWPVAMNGSFQVCPRRGLATEVGRKVAIHRSTAIGSEPDAPRVANERRPSGAAATPLYDRYRAPRCEAVRGGSASASAPQRSAVAESLRQDADDLRQR